MAWEAYERWESNGGGASPGPEGAGEHVAQKRGRRQYHRGRTHQGRRPAKDLRGNGRTASDDPNGDGSGGATE
eukprot:15438793-Alexandrium_andersonii.AAC.2